MVQQILDFVQICWQHFKRCLSLDFGVPLAEEKTCLPSTTLEFLGIEIYTCRVEFGLPVAKLNKLKWLTMSVLQKKKMRLKEMQSLLGASHLRVESCQLAGFFHAGFTWLYLV